MKFLYYLKNLIFILLGFSIPVSVAFTNVLIIFFIFVWLVEGDFLKKFTYLKSLNWVRSLMALGFCYFIALLYGEYHEDSIYVIKRICLLLFFIPLASSKFEQSTYRYAILTFLLTNLLSALFAIGINLNIFSSIIPNNPAISAFLLYNYHNILLSFSSILAFTLFINSKSKFSIIYLIFIIIYSISIFTEAGRGGQLTFNLFFIIFLCYFLNKKIFYSLSIFVFLLIINLSSYQSSGIYKNRVKNLTHIIKHNGQVKNSKKEDKIKDNRYVFFEESIELICKRPFFGYGTGSFSSVFIENTEYEYLLKYPNFDHKTPHNNFLYILFELGIIGLLFFLLIFYFQIKELLKLNSNKFELLLLPFFILFMMLFDSYLFIFTITVFYIFMFTIYSGYKLNDKKFL